MVFGPAGRTPPVAEAAALSVTCYVFADCYLPVRPGMVNVCPALSAEECTTKHGLQAASRHRELWRS